MEQISLGGFGRRVHEFLLQFLGLVIGAVHEFLLHFLGCLFDDLVFRQFPSVAVLPANFSFRVEAVFAVGAAFIADVFWSHEFPAKLAIPVR